MRKTISILTTIGVIILNIAVAFFLYSIVMKGESSSVMMVSPLLATISFIFLYNVYKNVQ